MSVAKSPYEIRLELLQMAKDFLDKQIQTQVDFALKAYEMQVKINGATIDQLESFMPKTYSIEDIMTKATELYGFVNKK